MKIALMLAVFFLVGTMLMRKRSEKEDRELAKEFSSTKVFDNSLGLSDLGYKPLRNVARSVDSIMCPRPGAVIREFKRQGYDVVLCQEARDICGKDVSEDTLSLWGKLKVCSTS